MTGYTVDSSALRTHADKLDGVKDDVDSAVAAGQTTLDPEAFGILCAFLYLPASQSVNDGIDALNQVGSTLTGLAKAVRTIAHGYDNVDDTVTSSFAKLAASIPES